MCRPLLPATKSPKHACRLGWNRTAFALLSAEQFHLRSLPGHWLARGRWSEPDRRVLELLDRRPRDKSGADIPKTGEVCFTSQLHLTQGDKLHGLEVANCGKSSEMNAERPRSRNAAKTSDEAGATPPFAARCVTGSVGSLPPHQFSEGTESLPRSTGSFAFFIGRRAADRVTGARMTRVTVPVTNPVTLKICESTLDTEVMNGIWTRGKHRSGLETPLLAKCLWPKKSQGSLQPITYSA